MGLFDRKKDEKKKIDDARDEAMVALAQDINQKFDVARIAKSAKTQMWVKCIDAYNSEYFKNKAKPDYKSDEISNFIFSTLETIKPIMVDNDPKIMVLPKSPEGIHVVDKIQNTFDAEWIRAKMGKKLAQGITIALQIGTAVFGVFWDGDDENGLGNATPVLINPFNLFPDPMATDVDNAEYIVYATYKHVNVLRKKFPRYANLLEGGAIKFDELVSQGANTQDVRNQVLTLECWMRDYTTMDVDEEIDGEVKKVRKQKYPKGRIVTVVPDLNLVLEDKPNPYEDGKFPFHLLKCYDVPFEFWGKGEVEQLLSPQTYINELVNQIVDNAKLTANMPWVIDKNSGIGKGQLTNRPGLIVRKNPGTTVDRLNPPSMPMYVQELVETFKRDIEIISGVHDVTQGRKPGSVSAASAIVALQEAAQARIRLKVKLMELTLSEMGVMWYARLRQFWKTDRWVRRNTAQQNPQMSEDDFVMVSPDDLQVNIDFMILAGSTMPMNKNAMLDLMIRLAQTGAEDGLPIVDRETVLQYTNIPDKRRIVAKFAEMSGQAKQAQQEEQMNAMAQEQLMAEHQAQVQQTANTNSTVTNPQLEQVMSMIMNDPLLQQQMIQMMSRQV